MITTPSTAGNRPSAHWNRRATGQNRCIWCCSDPSIRLPRYPVYGAEGAGSVRFAPETCALLRTSSCCLSEPGADNPAEPECTGPPGKALQRLARRSASRLPFHCVPQTARKPLIGSIQRKYQHYEISLWIGADPPENAAIQTFLLKTSSGSSFAPRGAEALIGEARRRCALAGLD